jgi:Family of unknown function (DUF6516)
VVGKKAPKPSITKTVNTEYVLTRPRKGAKLKEEVWESEDGQVVSYSLAYINHRICGVDNGRVLGYDNSHEYHHRHFMGTVEPIQFENYQGLFRRFYVEVYEMWKEEERK